MNEDDIEIELADEEYMDHRRRIIAVVLCAILVVLIILGVTYALVDQRNEDRMIEENAEKYNSSIRPLLEEEAEIKQELNELKTSSPGKTVENYGSVVLLCIEPGKWIIDDLKPICDLYDYKCTIAISENAYPGKDGYLSLSELQALIDDGWELCLSVQNTTQAEIISEKLEQDGFDRPENIYLPSGCGETSVDEFASHGYNNVVTHGEEKGDRVWTSYAIGCRESGVKNYLTNAVDSCECIVFSIGTLYTRETYTPELLNNLLGNIGSYVINGKMVVTSISEARERRITFENIVGEEARLRIERESELNKRLSEIQNEISELNTSTK